VSLPEHGEPTPSVIGQPNVSPTQLSPQDSIFFNQIGHGLLLLTIQPADQSGEKKPEGENVDHGASLHQRPRRTRRRSAELWDITIGRATNLGPYMQVR
jgi:hypothetical protein